MDYSIPITTVPHDTYFSGTHAMTNVILLDTKLMHSAPYTMIETSNHTIFLKK
jgi:hypothetical protein